MSQILSHTQSSSQPWLGPDAGEPHPGKIAGESRMFQGMGASSRTPLVPPSTSYPLPHDVRAPQPEQSGCAPPRSPPFTAPRASAHQAPRPPPGFEVPPQPSTSGWVPPGPPPPRSRHDSSASESEASEGESVASVRDSTSARLADLIYEVCPDSRPLFDARAPRCGFEAWFGQPEAAASKQRFRMYPRVAEMQEEVAARSEALACRAKRMTLSRVIPARARAYTLADDAVFASSQPVNSSFAQLAGSRAVGSRRWGSVTFSEMERLERLFQGQLEVTSSSLWLMSGILAMLKRDKFQPSDPTLFNSALSSVSAAVTFSEMERLERLFQGQLEVTSSSLWLMSGILAMLKRDKFQPSNPTLFNSALSSVSAAVTFSEMERLERLFQGQLEVTSSSLWLMSGILAMLKRDKFQPSDPTLFNSALSSVSAAVTFSEMERLERLFQGQLEVTSSSLWLMSGILAMLKRDKFQPSDPTLFNSALSSVSATLSRQARTAAAGSGFIRAQRRESLLAHTSLPVPETQKRSLTVTPGSSSGLFNAEFLSEVVSQVQSSSQISSNLALSRSLRRGRSAPTSSSSPLTGPRLSSFSRGRPYGKRSYSSSRSGGRKRLRVERGRLLLPDPRVSGGGSHPLSGPFPAVVCPSTGGTGERSRGWWRC